MRSAVAQVQAQRSKSFLHLMFRIPGVGAGKVDMPTQRRNVLQQSIRNSRPARFSCVTARSR